MADEFPVDSFKDAAPHLRRPFTPQAVKFKVQATWPKDNPDSALIVCYIDARLAVERLNLVCPHLWHDNYELVSKGQMWCHLTVDEITRSDVGEGDGKGLVSDALKRAAVKFGVGVSLYASTTIILKLSEGYVKKVQTNKGPSLALTPKGELQCRRIYANWLENHGIQSFGEPLDHGDVEEAVGDAEAEPVSHPEPAPADNDVPQNLLDAQRVDAITQGFKDKGLKLSDIDDLLASAGLDRLRARSRQAVLERVSGLTPDQADALEKALEGRESEVIPVPWEGAEAA